MTGHVIVDSVIWNAAFDKTDGKHRLGKEIVSNLLKQDRYTIVISNLILAEVANHLTKHANDISRDAIQKIINDKKMKIVYDDGESSDKARLIFNKFRQLGYVDAVTAFFYKQLKCRYFISFDTDFNAISDITRLECAPII